jgi:hypothetical protein
MLGQPLFRQGYLFAENLDLHLFVFEEEKENCNDPKEIEPKKFYEVVHPGSDQLCSGILCPQSY